LNDLPLLARGTRQEDRWILRATSRKFSICWK